MKPPRNGQAPKKILTLLGPDQAIDRLISTLPLPVQSYARYFFTALLWILFVESAVSLVTGSPFIRTVFLFLIGHAPHWAVSLLDLSWKALTFGAHLWRIILRDPTARAMKALGIRINPIWVDLLSAIVFGASAVLRSVRRARRFKTLVVKAAIGPDRTPAVLYTTATIANLIRLYAAADLEHDLPIVMANLDRVVLSIFEEILWFEGQVNGVKEAAVNVSGLIENVFGIGGAYYRGGPGMKVFVEQIMRPILKGSDTLSESQRLQIAEFLRESIPYIFHDHIGHHLARNIGNIFTGTRAQNRANRIAIIEISIICTVAILVLAITIADIFL